MADLAANIFFAAVAALSDAVKGVKANNEQAQEINSRAQRLATEFKRLSPATLASFYERGVFSELTESLASASDFCEKFTDKSYFKRFFSHAKDGINSLPATFSERVVSAR